MSPPLTRRDLIASLGAAAVAPWLSGCEENAPAAAADGKRATAPKVAFPFGVASGDPLQDAVIIWTRTTPDDGGKDVTLKWEVAEDEALTRVIQKGKAVARSEDDYTCKVDVRGLAPGRAYYYAFSAGGARSPAGRTRTAPAGLVDRLRLAVVTCSDFSRGLYNAYARIAERDDLDAVVHLGDYIYEGGRTDRVRPHDPPHKCVTLADYRRRYASYRTDTALQAVHARNPMIWVWDDHETCDGTWLGGADPKNHVNAEDGPFALRKAAALQAALEWMPIRSPDPSNPERIYRRFAFGDLAELFMLDTRRIGRDRPGEPNGPEGTGFTLTDEFADPARHLLGAEQEAWFSSALTGSRARWKLVGNQVVFAPIKLAGAPDATGASLYANPDQWDGYTPARDRILDAVQSAGVGNLVIFTGDVHAGMAFDVARDVNNPAVYDPVSGRGVFGVEFVAPSISSAGDPEDPDDAEELVEQLAVGNADLLRVANPHLKYIRGELNGYLLVDIDAARLRAEYWLVPWVGAPTDEESMDRAFEVRDGVAGLGPAIA